ncbi:methylated-DNA--protein-cysteine methyltransferase [Labrys miyagiensis]
MTTVRFSLFETKIGTCALAWGVKGLVSVQLPSADAAALRTRMKRLLPGAVEDEPPPEVVQAVAAIQALLAGEPVDLGWIDLDMDKVSDFNRQVYAIARAIPRGSTMTYGEIARKLGDPLLARAVGKAMGENPHPIVMPCHRVMAAGGGFGGFSAYGGVETKRRLLKIEGALPDDQPSLFGWI